MAATSLLAEIGWRLGSRLGMPRAAAAIVLSGNALRRFVRSHRSVSAAFSDVLQGAYLALVIPAGAGLTCLHPPRGLSFANAIAQLQAGARPEP